MLHSILVLVDDDWLITSSHFDENTLAALIQATFSSVLPVKTVCEAASLSDQH